MHPPGPAANYVAIIHKRKTGPHQKWRGPRKKGEIGPSIAQVTRATPATRYPWFLGTVWILCTSTHQRLHMTVLPVGR